VDVKTTRDIDNPNADKDIAKDIFLLWEYADTADSGNVYMAFPFVGPPLEDSTDDVRAGSDQVIDSSGNRVVVNADTATQTATRKIYTIVLERNETGGNAVTKAAIARAISGKIQDYESDSNNRTDYTCKLLAGVQTLGDVSHKKGVVSLFFVFTKLADNLGSCLMRTASNFAPANTAGEVTNKVASQVEVYKDNKIVGGIAISLSDYNQTWYKHRVRFRGSALQVELESTPGKDFELLGWTQQFYGKAD
jgi:hypothetical protein